MQSNQKRQFGRRREPVQIVIAKGSDVRSFSLRPWIATSLAMFAIVFTVSYLAATSYLVFRDDILGFKNQHADRMRHDYEDRIANLRSQIDKMTSRNLVDQEALETKVEIVLRKQKELNSRHQIISSVLDLARTSGLRVPITVKQPLAKPSSASFATDAMFLRTGTTPELPKIDTESYGSAKPRASLDLPDVDLDSTSQSVGKMAFETSVALDAVRAVAEARTRDIVTSLRPLGIRISDKEFAENTGLGGPYIPAMGPEGEEFALRAGLARQSLQRYLTVRDTLPTVPIGAPIDGARISSSFGKRLDPFLKRPAMHAGIDYAARYGHPVKASAEGKVIIAGRHGGYGKMVEIAHANGMTTRYAHLSRIHVKKGQKVPKGFKIGAVGSTGRSTGPHLHYEVRVGERPTNPMPFVRAGIKIRKALALN